MGEIGLVWSSRWSPIKILYFFNKYSVVADVIMAMHGPWCIFMAVGIEAR